MAVYKLTKEDKKQLTKIYADYFTWTLRLHAEVNEQALTIAEELKWQYLRSIPEFEYAVEYEESHKCFKKGLDKAYKKVFGL